MDLQRVNQQKEAIAAEKTTRIAEQKSNIDLLRQELDRMKMENQKMKDEHLRRDTEMEVTIKSLKEEKKVLEDERLSTDFNNAHESMRKQIKNPRTALNLKNAGVGATPTESTYRCEVADLPVIMNDANREGHSSSITTSVDALQTLQDCALEIIEEEEQDEEEKKDE